MSIASEITRITGNIADSYTAISGKGGTLPANQNSDNLASAITTIPSGGAGTKYNTDINCFLGNIDSNGVLQNASAPSNLVFTGVKKIGSITPETGVLFRRFQGLASVVSASFPDLEQIEDYRMQNCFYGCSNLESLSFDKLSSITGSYAFANCCYNCTKLTTLNMSNLATINGSDAMMNAFYGCTSLVSARIPAKAIINTKACEQMFYNCTNLEEVIFDVIKFTSSSNALSYGLRGCTKLKTIKFTNFNSMISSSSPFYWLTSNCYVSDIDVYFPSIYTTLPSDVFSGLLPTVTGGKIHFPSNLDPQTGSTVISSLSGYPNFNGTNTVLLYDLPSSAPLTGANSETYLRKAGDDTNSSLAWYNPLIGWGYGTFYTSGTTAPSVGDTIYSDSACTVAVTTIDSI